MVQLVLFNLKSLKFKSVSPLSLWWSSCTTEVITSTPTPGITAVLSTPQTLPHLMKKKIEFSSRDLYCFFHLIKWIPDATWLPHKSSLLSWQQLRRQPAKEHWAFRQTVTQLQRPRPLHQRCYRGWDLLLVLLRSVPQAGRGLLHLYCLRHWEEADQGEISLDQLTVFTRHICSDETFTNSLEFIFQADLVKLFCTILEIQPQTFCCGGIGKSTLSTKKSPFDVKILTSLNKTTATESPVIPFLTVAWLVIINCIFVLYQYKFMEGQSSLVIWQRKKQQGQFPSIVSVITVIDKVDSSTGYVNKRIYFLVLHFLPNSLWLKDSSGLWTSSMWSLCSWMFLFFIFFLNFTFWNKNKP